MVILQAFIQICWIIVSRICFWRNLSPSLLQWSGLQAKNFVSSGSKKNQRLQLRNYDLVIIERTIGLVLGPSTALYRSFLKHCTTPNKAMGTIWRDLSKLPQRTQGPDPRPLWLLVGTSSVLGPELASRWAVHSLRWQMPLYIFYHVTCLCSNLYCISALVGCWSSGLLKKDNLHIFKCVSFWLQDFAVSEKIWIP